MGLDGVSGCKGAVGSKRSAPNLFFEHLTFLGDARRGLRRQVPTQLGQDHLVILFGLRVTAKHQFASVAGGKMHVQHLDGGELLQ